MIAGANTTASIYRGTTTGLAGDEEDNNSTAAATGVPLGLGDELQAVRRYDQQDPRTVRIRPGRMPASTDVRQGDRLKDERTGLFYLVDSVENPGQSLWHTPDVRVDLRRTT